MAPLLRWLLASAVLGLGASLASAYVHARLLLDPSYQSVCDFNATWSCQTVYESRYSAVWGIPVALGGVFYFLAVLGLVAVSGWAARRPAEAGRAFAANVPIYLFALSVPALSVALYLGHASLFVLGALCLFCVLTYVAVAGVFVTAGLMTEGAMTSLPLRVWRDLRALVSSPVALTLTLLGVVGAASVVAFFPRAADGQGAPAVAQALTPAQQAEFEKWWASQPRVPVAEPTDGAKVLIVKFNDYQCPPCRQTYLDFKPVVARYQKLHPGKVKYVTKDYPLEPECNAQVNRELHGAACEAAAGVRMARAKGKAEAFEEWLFANQSLMTPQLVREGVRSVAGVADFDAQYPRVLDLVRGDIALGTQLGVRATPTFFINGVKTGGLHAAYFDAALALELAR